VLPPPIGDVVTTIDGPHEDQDAAGGDGGDAKRQRPNGAVVHAREHDHARTDGRAVEVGDLDRTHHGPEELGAVAREDTGGDRRREAIGEARVVHHRPGDRGRRPIGEHARERVDPGDVGQREADLVTGDERVLGEAVGHAVVPRATVGAAIAIVGLVLVGHPPDAEQILEPRQHRRRKRIVRRWRRWRRRRRGHPVILASRPSDRHSGYVAGTPGGQGGTRDTRRGRIVRGHDR
jgi:hypothetical protein